MAKEPAFSKMSDEEVFNRAVDGRVKIVATEEAKELKSEVVGLKANLQNQWAAEGNKIIADFAEEKKITIDEAMELAKSTVDHRITLGEAYKMKYFDKKKKANPGPESTLPGVAPVMPEFPTIKEALEAAIKTTGYKS